MQARAVLRGFRMSPQKVRLVADVVRGKPVDQALGDSTQYAAQSGRRSLQDDRVGGGERGEQLSDGSRRPDGQNDL